MKRHVLRFFTGLVLLSACLLAPGARAEQQQQQHAQRGPSTAEERARAVKVAHELESDPLAKDAKDNRDWVYKWIEDIPDITVNVCYDFFGTLPKPPRGHALEIVNQMAISSAAFIIEHPNKSKDEQSIATAGLLGALRAYQAVLKQDPDSRWPYLDKVVQMRDQGKLDDYVSDTRRKCEQEQEEPDPDTMRAAR